MARFYWSVAPRYTPGSPAGVDPDTAARVLVEEWRGFEHVIAGIYGPEQRRDALGDKLDGIVTAYEEPRSGTTLHYDLIRGTVERRSYDRHGQLKKVEPVGRDASTLAIDALRDQIAANLRAQRAAREAKRVSRLADEG
jgi:hypothetical protein